MADQNRNPKETPKTKDLPPKKVGQKDESNVKGGFSPVDGKRAL